MCGFPRARRRADRGAVGVEAALVLGFFLVPLMLGILAFGQYFWERQKVNGVNLSQGGAGIVGRLTCGDLKNQVLTLLQGTLNNAGVSLGRPLTLDDIVLNVVRGTANSIGIDVELSVHVPIVSTISTFLPDDGALVNAVLLKLDNVQLSGNIVSC